MITSNKTLILVIALALVASTAGFAQTAITVLVNKKPVDVAKVSPAILADEVLVPARLIAESTGARVDYDSATGTLTITCDSGTGILKRGSKVGWIRGTRVSFPSAPFIFDNQFYAPMLFFNEMFDQAWYWDPFYRQFRWVPIFPRWRGTARPPMIIPGPGRSDTYDTDERPYSSRPRRTRVVRPLPDKTTPKIVVQEDARAQTYALAENAVILRGPEGSAATEVPLSSLRPGDKLMLQRDSRGNVTLVRATYRQLSGTVRSISGNVVTLDTGEKITIAAQTQVFLPDNSVGAVQDLVTGDAVVASVDADTRIAYVIQVQPRIGALPVPDDPLNEIAVNTWGPLNAGDVLIVRFRAKPQGRAWFTIPGAAANVPMTELSSGMYEGSYIVQEGDIALREPIKVIYTEPDGASYTRLSQRPVTIRTRASYLPRITSPRQGSQIGSPVVVTGFATPGSRVRVVIEFRRVVEGVLPIQGVTAIHDVVADSTGRWQTPPLAAVAPFSDTEPQLRSDWGIFSDIYTWRDRERPTVYTITAVSIGAAGEERAAYSIDVTKQEGYTVGGVTTDPVEQNAGSRG